MRLFGARWNAPVTQLVEYLPFKQQVPRSSRGGGIKKKTG